MKCSFCGHDIAPGTGMIFVKKTGKTVNFCSGKCEKNALKLNRLPRKFKWTAASRALRKKKGAEK